MTETVRIIASFAVNAGTVGEATLPRARFEMVQERGAEPLVELVYGAAETCVGVCHRCAHAISDPEVGELAGFTVEYADGTSVDYNSDGTVYES